MRQYRSGYPSSLSQLWSWINIRRQKRIIQSGCVGKKDWLICGHPTPNPSLSCFTAGRPGVRLRKEQRLYTAKPFPSPCGPTYHSSFIFVWALVLAYKLAWQVGRTMWTLFRETSCPSGWYLFLCPTLDSWGNFHVFGVYHFSHQINWETLQNSFASVRPVVVPQG